MKELKDQSSASRPGPGAALAAQLADGARRRDKNRDLRPLAQLLPFIAAHRSDAIAAALALLISSSATLGLTGAARLVVDKGFAVGSAAAINRYFLALVAVALVLAAATALRFFFISKLGEGVTADLRKRVYAHVLTLDQAVFADLRTGEVLSRLTTDTTIVDTLVGSQASIALRNIVILVGSVAMLVVVSPKLTLGVLVIGPVVVAPMLLFGRRVRGLSVQAQDRFAEAVGFAGEHLDALDDLPQAAGVDRHHADDGMWRGRIARDRADELLRLGTGADQQHGRGAGHAPQPDMQRRVTDDAQRKPRTAEEGRQQDEAVHREGARQVV